MCSLLTRCVCVCSASAPRQSRIASHLAHLRLLRRVQEEVWQPQRLVTSTPYLPPPSLPVVCVASSNIRQEVLHGGLRFPDHLRHHRQQDLRCSRRFDTHRRTRTTIHSPPCAAIAKRRVPLLSDACSLVGDGGAVARQA